VAVFTRFQREKEAMLNWPDVIVIDGTHPQINIKWEVIPMTLVNGNRNIECGGIAFVAHFTIEMIVWLLKLI
jgi:hypothetical protein